MGSLSNFIENEILDHVLKTGDYTPPANLYVALSTADPTDDGSGIAEPSGNGYARVNHNSWDDSTGRATENTGTISFTEASGSWGTVTHFAIFDHVSAGNMIAHGALSASKTIGAGDNASFQDGAIDISFNSGGISNFLANAILDHIFGTETYDTTASIYVALSTANPTDSGSGLAEPAPAEYARVNHDSWDAAASGASENDGAITFPQCGSTQWGTVSYFAMFDAAEDGNMLFYGALDTPRAIGQSDTPLYMGGF